MPPLLAGRPRVLLADFLALSLAQRRRAFPGLDRPPPFGGLPRSLAGCLAELSAEGGGAFARPGRGTVGIAFSWLRLRRGDFGALPLAQPGWAAAAVRLPRGRGFSNVPPGLAMALGGARLLSIPRLWALPLLSPRRRRLPRRRLLLDLLAWAARCRGWIRFPLRAAGRQQRRHGASREQCRRAPLGPTSHFDFQMGLYFQRIRGRSIR